MTLPTVVQNILHNRHLLPKFVPGNEYFMYRTEDAIFSIIRNQDCDESRHLARILNDWLIGKYGYNLPSPRTE